MKSKLLLAWLALSLSLFAQITPYNVGGAFSPNLNYHVTGNWLFDGSITSNGANTWTGAQTFQGQPLTFFKPAQYSSGLFAKLSTPLTGNNAGTSPVTFNWQEAGFTNSGDATRDDNVFRMGWNISSGGGLSVPSQAATMLEMEDYYFPTGTSCGATGAQDESHWGYLDTSGNIHRVMSWCGKIAQDLSQLSLTFGTVANSGLNFDSGATQLWNLQPDGVWRATFTNGTTTSCLLEMFDAAGQDCIEQLGAQNAWQISTGNQSTNYYFYPTVGFWNNNNQGLGFSGHPWSALWLGSAGTSAHQITSNATAARTLVLPDGNTSTVLVAALTTTAATSDTVTLQGMTSSGHCQLTPTNASGATNITTTYVSAKAANQITVTHTATASMTYDVMCTAN